MTSARPLRQGPTSLDAVVTELGEHGVVDVARADIPGALEDWAEAVIEAAAGSGLTARVTDRPGCVRVFDVEH